MSERSKQIKELDDIWQTIFKIKDPMEFIDMLAANSYFAGRFNGKVPVNETRTVFLAWLERYDNRRKQQ